MQITRALRVLPVLIGWLGMTVHTAAESSYRVIPVRNGGTIEGTVRVNPGTTGPRALAVDKDDKICGRQKPSPRLTAGRDLGVVNAVVAIQGIREGKKPDTKDTYLLNQEGCEYIPHMTVMPVGATLEIMNSDPVLHNVHAYDEREPGRTVFNIAQPVKGQRTPIRYTTFRKPGVYHATCDAGHPWMSAFVMVVEHPYYAVTDKHGRFSLDNVPPGTYAVTMWHAGVHVTRTLTDGGKPRAYIFEQPYELSRQVTVTAGERVELNFEFSLRSP